MSKEIEALYRILDYIDKNSDYYQGNDVSKDYTILKSALTEYEAIKNAEPSEALECLDKMTNYILLDEEYGFIDNEEKQVIIEDSNTIKQALLKAQEPKQYLKWEDLEFGVNKHKIKVKFNDSLYVVEWLVDGYRFKTVNFYAYVCKDNLQPMFYLQEDKKQFFNDLRLERVEE